MVLFAAGCAQQQPGTEFNDPHEAVNRKVHAANIALDRALVRPSASAYGAVVPKPLQQGLENISDTFGLPGDVVNNLLQGDIEHVVENTFRFAINATLGVGGLFDPATSIGLAGRPSDFGETLFVWGAGEGAYIELPFLGPSTERDFAGKVVDVVIDPLGFVLPKPEKYIGTVAGVAAKIGDRDKYSDLVDGILYDSADSYAQSRLLYLQNRRYDLGDTSNDDEFDPYEDPYAP